jgi:hypothetical protein
MEVGRFARTLSAQVGLVQRDVRGVIQPLATHGLGLTVASHLAIYARAHHGAMHMARHAYAWPRRAAAHQRARTHGHQPPSMGVSGPDAKGCEYREYSLH